jgi:hypothetical protein
MGDVTFGLVPMMYLNPPVPVDTSLWFLSIKVTISSLHVLDAVP